MAADMQIVPTTPPTAAVPTQESDAALVKRLGLEQPFECLVDAGKPLTPFQLLLRRMIIRNKRVIGSLDKGLGKTLVALSTFESEEVHKNTPGFTVVIFTTQRGMGAYVRDIKHFPEWEDKIQLINGKPEVRKEQWRNSRARYFIVTPASFLEDMGVREGKYTNTVNRLPKWLLDGSVDAWLFDEFHRYMRRHKGKFFNTIRPILLKAFKADKYIYLYSGSAVSKGPEDLWAALHLVDPKLWSSFWSYVGTWCLVIDGHFGKQVCGPNPQRVARWRAAVGPYVFHRTKQMVGNQVPPKRRDFLEVHLPQWQRKLHNDLKDEMVAQVGGDDSEEYIFSTNNLANLFKIRTAMICPKALHEDLPVGADIEAIWDDAQESELSSYVVATPFKAPIPHLQAWLEGKGARVWVLQGGIGLAEQERRLADWRASLPNATGDRPSIILYTIKYGESWEAPETSYGYMLGYEWDPEENKQAEDRIHRLSSTDPVFWLWVKNVGCYDEDHITRLSDKSRDVRMMYGIPDEMAG